MKKLALALFLASCAPAYAQMQCAPHSVIEELNAEHGMETASRGMVGDDAIETYANPVNNRFVVVVRRSDGITCVLVMGSEFEVKPWGKST